MLAAQSFVFAEEFVLAVETFENVIQDEKHPPALIAEAMYWCGDAYLKVSAGRRGGGRRRGGSGLGKDVDPVRKAYQLFKRLDWDYPTTTWARYARGRLAREEGFDRIEE